MNMSDAVAKWIVEIKLPDGSVERVEFTGANPEKLARGYERWRNETGPGIGYVWEER